MQARTFLQTSILSKTAYAVLHFLELLVPLPCKPCIDYRP
jgi:hypothetical protein